MPRVVCEESWQCHNVLWLMSLHEMLAIPSLPRGGTQEIAARFDASDRMITGVVEASREGAGALPLSLLVRRQRGFLAIDHVTVADALQRETIAWFKALEGRKIWRSSFEVEKHAQNAANMQVLSGIFASKLHDPAFSFKEVYVWIDLGTGRASAINFMRMPSGKVRGEAVKFTILENHPDMVRITCAQQAMLALMAPMYAAFFTRPFITIKPSVLSGEVFGEGAPETQGSDLGTGEATGGLAG